MSGSRPPTLRHLEEALAQVGPNPHLYAGLAYAHWQRVNLGLAQEEGIAVMEGYLSQALALDPDCSSALTVRGAAEQAFRGRLRESVHVLKRALVVNPGEPMALVMLAAAYVNLAGKVEAAIPLAERLRKMDPLSIPTQWIQGAVRFFDGRHDAAAGVWRRMHEGAPDSPMHRSYYALAEAYRGRRDTALAVLDRLGDEDATNAGVRFCRILRCALLGDKAGALGQLTAEFRRTVSRDGGWGHVVAANLAESGAEAEASDILEQAVHAGFIHYPMMAKHDPFLAKLRGKERFEKLLVRVEREWEAFEV